MGSFLLSLKQRIHSDKKKKSPFSRIYRIKMANFEGTWKLEKHENFDDFLKQIGMGMIKRKVAVNLKPHISFLNVTDQGFHWVNDSITKEEKDFVWGRNNQTRRQPATTVLRF